MINKKQISIISGSLFKEDIYLENDDNLINLLIADNTKISFNKEFLSKYSSLKHIVFTSTGFDNLDLDYCKQNNISITSVPDYASISVAEYILAGILHFYKNAQKHTENVKCGNWRNNLNFKRELTGKTIGIIGFGGIGRAFAKLLQGFDVNLLINDIRLIDNFNQKFIQVERDDILKLSDVICLTLSGVFNHENILNKNKFDSMKKNALLVNVSRGQNLSENDLADHLNHNQDFSAVLDVFEQEPIDMLNPLLSVQNLLLSPHYAWHTKEATQKRISGVFNVFKNLNVDEYSLNFLRDSLKVSF